jgi:HupE / UreJ protein
MPDLLHRAKHLVCAILTCFAATTGALAHKASDAYLQVTDTRVQLSLALKDLDAALETLDTDQNRALTWSEVKAGMPAVLALVSQGVGIACDTKRLELAWSMESLERRSDGVYLRVGSPYACPTPKPATLVYQLLDGIDSSHRLLVGGTLNGLAIALAVTPHESKAVALASAGESVLTTVWRFIPQGMHHIATGYDHLAFLLSLLLPITLVAGAGALRQLTITVTAFTLGHSITLALASLGVIASPSWVEPVIALSIAASAALNLRPVSWLNPGYLALGFGLVHGLGFANLLLEAKVAEPLLPWALLGFNLGVEAGQLLGVALWCLLSFGLARWRHYQRVVVQGGSVALIALALFWTGQRLAL